MPIRIEYTMVNGQVFVETKCSFKEGAPFATTTEAIVQAKSRLEKYEWVTADGGAWIICKHIASLKIVSD